MEQHNTAILLFANSAQEDISRKAIGGSLNLFKKLNEKTLAVVKQSKLPYFHITEDQQVGLTFGERFTHAIKAVYAKGYDNVITIGNDTPHLKASQLIQTAEKLKHTKFVLGPSYDGGFYLMGLHKSQFNEKLFIKLPWQSRRLAKHITRLLTKAKVEVVKLEMLQDIDSEGDLQDILNSIKYIASEIKALLIALVISARLYIIDSIETSITVWIPKLFNKGSPLVLST